MALKQLTVWYRVSDTDTVESMVVVKREYWKGRGWIVKEADGNWMPQEDCFMSARQCRQFHGLVNHEGLKTKKKTQQMLAKQASDMESTAAKLRELSRTLDYPELH